MLGFVLTMGSFPVAIFVAESQVKEKGLSLAWTFAKYIIPYTLVCFAVFFINIERKYRNTFWSTQRSKDYTMAYYHKGMSDKVKIAVFGSSRHHWVSNEEEIRKGVGENWAKWEEEKPEWFTDTRKAQVPVEFIPATGDARRRESVRRASVDAEAEGGLGGGLRASLRRASVGSAASRVVPIEEDN